MVQRRYDKEFKINAVELLLNSGKPLKPLAKELDLYVLVAYPQTLDEIEVAGCESGTGFVEHQFHKPGRLFQRQRNVPNADALSVAER